MDRKLLFVMIHRTLHPEWPDFIPAKLGSDIYVNVAKNHGGKTSHITLEYVGDCHSTYFSCLTFDGTGDNGTGLSGFAMPRHKLTMTQKFYICLAILEFLSCKEFIQADIQYYRDKLATQLNAGWGPLEHYDLLRHKAANDIMGHVQSRRLKHAK